MVVFGGHKNKIQVLELEMGVQSTVCCQLIVSLRVSKSFVGNIYIILVASWN